MFTAVSGKKKVRGTNWLLLNDTYRNSRWLTSMEIVYVV